MLSTGAKGDIGVAMVIADLLSQGFEVLMPVSADSPFDVVAYKDGKFYRLQVKYREVKSGTVTACLRRVIASSGKFRYSPLTESDVDFLVIYCPCTKGCYYIKRKEISGSVTLRIEPALNGQAAGVRTAEDYKKFLACE